MVDLDTYSTYSSDKELFKKLNLKEFNNIPNWEQIEVGSVETEDYTIKISVMGCPAQFWMVEITPTTKAETIRVETGSGCLSDYWDSVEKIAQGMLTITIFN